MKVLRFGADWCPECVIMKPRWEEAESQFPGLAVEYFDVDDNKDLVKDWNIDHVPTFIFVNDRKQEISRLRGIVETAELIKTINEAKLNF